MRTYISLFRGNPLATLIILIIAFTLLSCSHSENPVDPSLEMANATDPGLSGVTADPMKVCWGLWDVYLDESGEFVTVPIRDAMYTINVVQYLQPPYGTTANMQVAIVDESKFITQGRLSANVTLVHPFPEYDEYCGFDVLGVFINKGDQTAKHDSKIKYAEPATNPILENADGYTRWMNPHEFTASGLGGFTQGALGDKNVVWTATINPYRYYCDGLGATETIANHYSSSGSVSNRGIFKAGSSNTRRYDLIFPKVGGVPQARFQYAVVASWVEPMKTPPTNLPGDFPFDANMVEPLYVSVDTDGSTTYYNSSSDRGGNLLLTLEVFAQGARTDPDKVEGQIESITIESPSGFIAASSGIEFDAGNWGASPGTTQISQKFTLDCGEVNPQGPEPEDNYILITVESQSGDLDTGVGTPHPTGRSKYYQVFKVPLSDWSPNAPGIVQNFQASDADPSLAIHRVELTWDVEPIADEYEIQRYDYDPDGESWSWVHLISLGAPTTLYVDNNARYCGTENPIEYRIRASNTYGNSPGWANDTGYPKLRDVGITFWCAATDGSGSNPVVQWSRAFADFTDCNNFWNPYGFNMVMENSGTFFWMTNPAYRQITGLEDQLMHDEFGNQDPHWFNINVYYVQSVNGDTAAAYDVAICPGSQHDTHTTFIVMGQDARVACPGGQELPIILAHEVGHALPRYWDVYLLNTTCANDNTWCTGPPPFIPPMYCDEGAKYNGNLMYFSLCNTPVSAYDLTVGQYIEASERVRTYEANYPVP